MLGWRMDSALTPTPPVHTPSSLALRYRACISHLPPSTHARALSVVLVLYGAASIQDDDVDYAPDEGSHHGIVKRSTHTSVTCDTCVWCRTTHAARRTPLTPVCGAARRTTHDARRIRTCMRAGRGIASRVTVHVGSTSIHHLGSTPLSIAQYPRHVLGNQLPVHVRGISRVGTGEHTQAC